MRQMPYTAGWHDVREKPSGKFEARWADEDGKARGKCFLTESQANRYAIEKAKEILDGVNGWGIITKNAADAIANFLSRYTDAGTIALYERHLEDFLSAHPEVTMTGHLTKDLMEKYNVELSVKDANGKPAHNSGGRRTILKTLKRFCNYCREQNWLKVDPFFRFVMPKQEFEGRALNPGEYARMISVSPDTRYQDVDLWINRALRIGNSSILRISSVWKLTPKDFREPDLLFVEVIKGQPPVWINLHPIALAAIREVLAITPAGQRLFSRWPTVDSMRQSIRKKAYRVGLDGTRFHDAGKVSRITELDAAGYGLGKLSALSNTSKTTLAKYYIKADRRRAFLEYQTYGGPTEGGKTALIPDLGALDRAKAEIENDARTSEIDDIRRAGNI